MTGTMAETQSPPDAEGSRSHPAAGAVAGAEAGRGRHVESEAGPGAGIGRPPAAQQITERTLPSCRPCAPASSSRPPDLAAPDG